MMSSYYLHTEFWLVFSFLHMLLFKSLMPVSFFFFLISTFIQQGCIKLLKSDS